MDAFNFDEERQRVRGLIQQHGLQAVEDLLLSTGLAVLDSAEGNPIRARDYRKYNKALDRAKRNLTKVRICDFKEKESNV